MPITINATRPRADLTRLEDRYRELMGKLDEVPDVEQAAEETRRLVLGLPLNNSGVALTGGGETKKIEYVTEENVKNVLALFSGYFIHFDFGPKRVAKMTDALKNVPVWVLMEEALNQLTTPCFLAPDPDVFCRMVHQRLKFADVK